MASTQFSPVRDIPNLSHKVVLVTGGTSGAGLETVKYLAEHNPSQILFTGRNGKAAATLVELLKESHPKIAIEYVACDQSSLKSVRQASKTILSSVSRLDLVFCNAGVMVLPPGLSEDGYEQQFATNHLGHAFMIDILLPLLLDTAAQPASDVRIVFTTSQAARSPLPPTGGIQFAALRTKQDMMFGTWRRYGQSKLANLLYARALNKHHPSITTVSIHPGISYTGLQRTMGWFNRLVMWFTTLGWIIPANELAWSGLWAATARLGDKQGEVQGGAYYEPVGVRPQLSDHRGDTELEAELWDWTQKELRAWKETVGHKTSRG